MSQFSDETLMAFADGQLAEAEFDAVAEAVETDAAVAARLQALVEGARLAKEGYGVLLEPVPRALDARVRAAIAKARAVPRWRLAWDGLRLSPSGAAAVALVATVIVLPIGYGLGQAGGPAAPTMSLAEAALGDALDRLPAGQAEVLADGLTVVPVATFADAGGTLCREFETSGREASVNIACRVDGVWQTQLSIAVGGESGYRPASGLEAIDAYLDAIGAGEILLDAAEAAALAGERR